MSKLLLVTGGLGFIGKNFCKLNNLLCDEKIIIDKFSYASDLNFYIKELKPVGWKLIIEDISNIENIKALQGYDEIDILNFAAESHVDNSFELSELFLKENTMATLKLLNYVKSSISKIRLLHISTDEVYGAVDNHPATELSRLNPTNPYSASKAAGDLLAQTYKTCFSVNLKIIRANNIFGPGQLEEKLIPKAIVFSKRRENFYLHGSKKIKRHFVHVHDFTSAIEIIFKQWEIESFHIYNISGDESYFISDVVDKIYSENGLDPNEFIKIGEDRPFNDIEYKVDDTRLRALGWKPKIIFWEELSKLNRENSILSNNKYAF